MSASVASERTARSTLVPRSGAADAAAGSSAAASIAAVRTPGASRPTMLMPARSRIASRIPDALPPSASRGHGEGSRQREQKESVPPATGKESAAPRGIRQGMKPAVAAGSKSPEPEPTAAEFEFEASPRRLHDALASVGAALRCGSPDIARRVRLLLGEVMARSCDPRRNPTGSLRIELTILPSRVRAEITGAALLTPQEGGDAEQDGVASFPAWVLNGLATQWGLDGRPGQPTMWLVVEPAPPQANRAPVGLESWAATSARARWPGGAARPAVGIGSPA